MIEYMSAADVADAHGLKASTIATYVRDGYMPPFDAKIGRVGGWLPDTIDKWAANRPGRGARTDLKSC